MKDQQTQQQFIQLRAAGRSFASIAQELDVSKPTLIAWSRKFRFEIQNLRAIESEALAEEFLATREDRARNLSDQLRSVESELAARNLADLSTQRLFAMAESLRRQLRSEFGEPTFTTRLNDIPSEEYCDEVQHWKP
jgi:transposase